jgi:hypothetical protein
VCVAAEDATHVSDGELAEDDRRLALDCSVLSADCDAADDVAHQVAGVDEDR